MVSEITKPAKNFLKVNKTRALPLDDGINASSKYIL